MKKTILSFSILYFLASCGPSKAELEAAAIADPTKYKHYTIFIADGCEYIQTETTTLHKFNCKNHKSN